MVTSIAALSAGWFSSRVLRASIGTNSAGPIAAPANPARPQPSANSSPAPSSGPTLSERLDRAMEAVAKSGSSTERIVALFTVAETLKNDEFKAAVGLAMTSPKLQGYSSLLFGYWIERDLPKALEWYGSLDSKLQSRYASTVMGTWSVMDPRASLDWLEKQPEALVKSVVASEQYTLARNIGPAEPDRVLALLMPLAGDSGMIGRISDGPGFTQGGNLSGVTVFFSAYAEISPADAAARAMRFPSGTQRTSAAIAVAKGWARKDPTAAKAWAEKIDDAALSGQVIPACAIGLAEKDPKQAAEWLADMAGTLPNREGMKEVLTIWGRKDMDAAFAWLDSLPPDSSVKELTGSVFREIARKDPARMLDVIKRRLDENKLLGGDFTSFFAFDYVRAKGVKGTLEFAESSLQHEDSEPSLRVYRALVNAAAQDNPSETAAWAQRQLNGERRSAALTLSASFFVQSNEEAGFQWLNSLPKEPDSDEARMEIAGRLFQKQPEKAAELYSGVTDHERADNKLMWQAYWALLANKPGASEWLDKTPALNAEQKTKVRTEVKKNSK